jgi:hypothetical protein
VGGDYFWLGPLLRSCLRGFQFLRLSFFYYLGELGLSILYDVAVEGLLDRVLGFPPSPVIRRRRTPPFLLPLQIT